MNDLAIERGDVSLILEELIRVIPPGSESSIRASNLDKTGLLGGG